MKKQTPIPVLLLFSLMGLYSFLLGLSPVKVEINSTGTESQAQIHRKSMIPPFKTIDIMVSNVKQAIITSSRSSKGAINYRIELEDFKGYRYPITAYYSSGYKSKANLQDRINDSIRNRTEYKNTFRQPFFIFFGLFFIFISVITFKVEKKINKKTSPYQNIPQQTQQPDFEEEKYKNINDSIIK